DSALRTLHTFPTRRSSDLSVTEKAPARYSPCESGRGGCSSPLRSRAAKAQKQKGGRLRMTREQFAKLLGFSDYEKLIQESEPVRSEEHTSELQSREKLVCR